jgi:hypothetical protein
MVEYKQPQRVFYSWQDDTARKDNRYFIEDALKRAIKTVNKDDAVMDELIIDRDTKDIPGAPLIAEAILAKIDASAMFVADVTIIGRANSGKPITNPNVMTEFGYALKTLADDDLVLVFNEAYGGIPDLPFDLKHRRVMRYNLPPQDGTEDDSTRALRREVAQTLQRDLEAALRTWTNKRVKSVPTVPSPIEQFEEYLLDPGSVRRAIRVLDLEIDKFHQGIEAISNSAISRDQTPAGVFQLMQAYEKLASDLLPVFIRACYEDDGAFIQALVRGLSSLAHTPAIDHDFGEPQLYPALVVLYAGGIAALAGKRFSTLIALLRNVKIRTKDDRRGAVAARHLTPHRVVDERVAKNLPPVVANHTPISTYFFSLLREPLRLVIKIDGEYAEDFFLFEYLFALASALAHKEVWGASAAPTGSYIWEQNLRTPPYIYEVADKELKSQGDSWPPFKAGIFDGTFEEFLTFKQEVDESIKKEIRLHYPGIV